MKTKQVIVIRKDLNMRKGKQISQGSHASMKVFLDNCDKDNFRYIFTFEKNSYWDNWLNGIFTKIVLSCDSEEELDNLYNQAKKQNIPCSMIIDAGLTEFNGIPTKTCIAIGPYDSDEIDKITGKLKLL